MQLAHHTMNFVAVSTSVSAAHQPALLFAGPAALLLALTGGIALIALCSRESGQRLVMPTVRDQVLTTTPSQNLDTGADRNGSPASHSGSGNQPGKRWWRPQRGVFWHAWRRQNMAVFTALIVVAILLLGWGWGINQYFQNVAINVGADLIGAILTIFVIMPIVSRAVEGRVREHPTLDYGWYVDQVAGSTSTVRILDTYSNLLDGPHTQNFFQAVKRALERQTVVQILLLDPGSLHMRPSGPELDDPDPYLEIMRNLRVLCHFRNAELPVSMSHKFGVHVYAAPSSITLYRWDDKTMVSFPSRSNLSSQGAQLEVTTGSPLGEYANKYFNSLWNSSVDIERFMYLPVTLAGDDLTDSRFIEFVQLNNRTYLGSSRLIAQMARRGTKSVRAYLDYDHQKFNELTIVDDDQPELCATISDRFCEKYGHSHDVFIGLEPITEETR